MPRTDYQQPATSDAEQLIQALFDIGGVGYVALGSGQEVLMRSAPGITGETTAETNFYEELLVNPTLLKLASQRAELDCGGLNFIAIGYGHFIQLIMRMKDGHVSLGVSRKTAVGEFAAKVRDVLERLGRLPRTTEPSLLA